MIKWLKSFFTRPKYIVSREVAGVVYYYMGKGKWTPSFEGAKIYKDNPSTSWKPKCYKIEKV